MRHPASRLVEVSQADEALVQRPEQVSDQRARVAYDADEDDRHDDHRDALVSARLLRPVLPPPRPSPSPRPHASSHPSAAGDAECPSHPVRRAQRHQEARVENDEDRHRHQVHEEQVKADAVGGSVGVVLDEVGVTEIPLSIAQLALEKSRQREQEGEDGDGGHVLVGSGERAETLGL